MYNDSHLLQVLFVAHGAEPLVFNSSKKSTAIFAERREGLLGVARLLSTHTDCCFISVFFLFSDTFSLSRLICTTYFYRESVLDISEILFLRLDFSSFSLFQCSGRTGQTLDSLSSK